MNYKELLKNYPALFSNQDALIEIISDDLEISTWQAERRKALSEKNLPLEWADIGVVFHNPYTLLVRDLVRFPGGTVSAYSRELSLDQEGFGVVVFPVLQKQILLLEHFRHATRSWHFEVPRGFPEKHLSAEDNARKELEEETGWKAKTILPLGLLHDNTGASNSLVHLFLAVLDQADAPAAGFDNFIKEGIRRTFFVGLKEFESMVIKNQITDSFTLSAYARAHVLGHLD